MKETFFIITEQNQNNASTLACQTGGLVVVVGSTTISNDSEKSGVWTITPIAWVQNSQSYFSSFSEVEYALIQMGIFYKMPFVSEKSFVVCVSETTPQTCGGVINFIAENLSENKNFNIVIY